MSRLQSALAGLVDLESDDELDGILGAKQNYSRRQKPQRQQPHAMPPAKKARGRPAAANKGGKVAKPASNSSARRNSGRLASAVEDAEERSALSEKSANPQPKVRGRGRRGAAAAKEEVPATPDEEAAPDSPVPDVAKPKVTRGRPKKTAQGDTAPAPAPAPAATKRGRRRAAEPEEEIEIPETQQQPQHDPSPEEDPMDIDAEEESIMQPPGDVTGHEIVVAEPPANAARVASSSGRQSVSASGVSASSEGGEPALRRRLGELSKKHESLETRYRDLRDVAVREAEGNFERLRKQSEERAAAAAQLIASLKAEVAAQKELAREGQRVKSQLQTSEARVDELQAQVTQMAGSLSESKAEAKSLSTRLAASRSAEVAAAAAAATSSAKVPGSAVKGGGGGPRKPGEAAVYQATQMQMKEDLYGDLTGLIVRGVKKEGGDDVFDCIQTGRNGTLHFKLSISNDTASEKYDEAEYLYMPQLDPGRDCELISVLPDYLVEEITFPRTHAAKFYSRVIKSLNELPEE